VMLTALTTALGLVPLAIGLNLDFFGLYGSLNPDFYWGGDQAAWWSPMAVAVIVGILFATFLTLVLVPVMYSLVDDFSAFFKKHFVASENDGSGDQGLKDGDVEAEDIETSVPAREEEPVHAFRRRAGPFGPPRPLTQAD